MARVDPYKNFRFLVEIDGIVQAGFSECSGFGSNVEVVEYREGGEPSTVRKLPGKISYPDITLKWGVTDSRELYDWHLTAVNGEVRPAQRLHHPAGRRGAGEDPLELLQRLAEQVRRAGLQRQGQRRRHRHLDGELRTSGARRERREATHVPDRIRIHAADRLRR